MSFSLKTDTGCYRGAKLARTAGNTLYRASSARRIAGSARYRPNTIGRMSGNNRNRTYGKPTSSG